MYVPQLGIHVTDETETLTEVTVEQLEERLIEQVERNSNYPKNLTTLQASLRTDILQELESFWMGNKCWREKKLQVADALTGNARTNAYKTMLYHFRNVRTKERIQHAKERKPADLTTLQASLRSDILTKSGGFKENTWGEHKLQVADALIGNARTCAYKEMLRGLRSDGYTSERP